MSIGKEEVLDVLADLRLHSIRFSVGPITVNVDEYGRVADLVDSGAIEIKPTKKPYNFYLAQINTLFLRDGDARADLAVRSSILHECTHIIADINKVAVLKLTDEAAAYLAQFSFLKLLDPSFEALPSRADPVLNLMRVGLDLVAKYSLGQPAGFGAIISSRDIFDLGRVVQRHPDYRDIKDEEKLIADGVNLTEKQASAREANRLARLANKTKYEDWLLSTVSAAQTGGAQKQSAYAQLSQHFFMVYLPVATVLLARLSAVKPGDALSERFDRFTAQEKYELLEQLRMPKPPG